jgi:hypothetical protein
MGSDTSGNNTDDCCDGGTSTSSSSIPLPTSSAAVSSIHMKSESRMAFRKSSNDDTDENTVTTIDRSCNNDISRTTTNTVTTHNTTTMKDIKPPDKGTTGSKWLFSLRNNTFLQYIIIVVPYLIGVVWHMYGHVNYSILTGDFQNPKRSYIDENSLDPNHFQLYGTYHDISTTATSTITSTSFTNTNTNNTPWDIQKSLCESIRHQTMMTGITIPCFQYDPITHHHHYRHRRKRTANGNSASIDRWEIVKITPLATGIIPNTEAIVLVVPPFHPNQSLLQQQQFQTSLLQLIQRLSSPITTPWLSKTIFIVAPLVVPTSPTSSFTTNHTTATTTPQTKLSTSMIPLLENTVRSFLNTYLGDSTSISESGVAKESSSSLPPEFMGCILRHVLVVDFETFEPMYDNTIVIKEKEEQQLLLPHIHYRNEIRILSSGRRGVLPNMDLTFLCKFIYERSNMVQQLQPIYHKSNQKYTMTDVVVHPYQKWIIRHLASIRQHIEPIKERYISKLPETFAALISTTVLPMILSWYESVLPLLTYEWILRIGPYPPHTPALERGIDSITLQGSFATTTNRISPNSISPQQYIMEYVQRLELVIRSLSNLHERLHHSTSLYLLVSKDRFVKHEEYLIPNILLILPLLIRAILYILISDEKQDDGDGSNDENETSHGIIAPTSTSTLEEDNSNNNNNYSNNGIDCTHSRKLKRRKLHEFGFTAIGQALLISFVWTTLSCDLLRYYIPLLPNDNDTTSMSFVEYIPYRYPMTILYALFVSILAKFSQWKELGSSTFLWCPIDRKYQRCIQFVSCLLATYIHVGIAFGHVSLAYPSALVWTPLLAFPTYNYRPQDVDRKVGPIEFFSAIGIFVITAPFTCLVPDIFPTYTPYVRYIYIPLHMMFCVQHIIPMIHRG